MTLDDPKGTPRIRGNDKEARDDKRYNKKPHVKAWGYFLNVFNYRRERRFYHHLQKLS
jgi:hypothetical protein